MVPWVPAMVCIGNPYTAKVEAAAGFTVKEDVPETVPDVALIVQGPDLDDV